ncbi:Phosphatidylglycerophosphate synthase [Alteracholeplasma palmae J233]|uniref:CDP-diacylglycerol--glycerol-3-phosphate 3-phosphatidyltransferase n=1 Tax=Alteracholeplasma palmae (strain ATCC 49389 / J233) TaxID=1318466 RepID=U4KKU1_ALTPJ|nr:CDP-diacylglycerol--glycerol-3-phosphate 3-phosphatidyltransferase [Alteracholeplasma palmae]CCV64288.1 Phosphatidylglycerophosphate synthase [Alteracholeplasma palmae J233]
MTTANKITIFRVFLIPVMLILIYIPGLEQEIGFLDLKLARLLFTIIFIIASLTDFLDGYIARKYKQITTFGKFLDPLADKVLVLTAFLYLMILMPDRVTVWAVMIVIIREFMVTGIRLLAVEKGVVIAASKYGKLKTATTMVALIWLLFNDFGLPAIIGDILFYLAIILTVVSGLEYFFKNKKVILESV